jgi:hypothetical protein
MALAYYGTELIMAVNFYYSGPVLHKSNCVTSKYVWKQLFVQIDTAE